MDVSSETPETRSLEVVRNGANGKEALEIDSFINDSIETSLKSGPSKSIAKSLKEWFTFESNCQRQNFIQTMCIYLNFVMLGWNYGVLGTAFKDIQQVLDTNVKRTAFIFTMNSVGYMTGSLSLGFIYDRVDKLLLLGLVSIAIAILCAVIPWCRNYWVFLVVRLLTGIVCGGQDSGGNAKIASCWGTGGAQYMQALHFAYAFGGIISPLVTSLFLAPRIYDTGLNNASDVTLAPYLGDGNYTAGDVTYNVTGTMLASGYVTWTHDVIPGNWTLNVTDLVMLQDSIEMDEPKTQYGQTKIHIIFLITGFITALAGCCYLALYFLGFEHVRPYYAGQVTDRNQTNSNEYPAKSKQHTELSRKGTVIFITCMAISIIAYTTIECKLQSFLMPFLSMQLDWEKHQCAYAISLVWAFYGLGRLLGVPISRCMSSFKVLVTFMSSTLVCSIGLFVGAFVRIDVLVWIAVPLTGLSISVIYPSFLIWTDEYAMPLTGKIVGLYAFFGSLGFLIGPLYIGVLMENVSPMFFTYVQITEIFLCLLVFIVVAVRLRNYKLNQKGAIDGKC